MRKLLERIRSVIVLGPADSAYGKMVLAAVTIGIVFVFSASFPVADKTLFAERSTEFLSEQVKFAFLGFGALYVVSHLAPTFLAMASLALFPVGLVAMALCVRSPWAHPVAGCAGWLEIAGRTFQPSEFVKVLYVAVLAWIMSRPGSGRATHGRIWLYTFLSLGLMCVLLAVQKDIGMMFLVVGLTLGMLYIRGMNGWVLAGVSGGMGAVGLLAIATFLPGRWERVIIFLDPHSDPNGAGYHLCQMLATLARGGISGLGLGMSPDKWGGLPAPHTDSIFCVIGAELGLVGAALILLLIFAMAARSFKIAERSGTSLSWLLACGIGALLGLQSLVNVAVATVSMPCTGLTLPFISYGGSSLVSSMIAAGMVLAISRYAAQSKEEGPRCAQF